MKKTPILLSIALIALSFIKCGPAAEDRFKMHENANHISDSISKVIDAALAQGAIPNSPIPATVADTSAKPTK